MKIAQITMKLLIFCLLLVSCDKEGITVYGTVVEVNDTGAKVQWNDGKTGSYRVMGAVFEEDRVCANSQGAWTGGCQIIIEGNPQKNNFFWIDRSKAFEELKKSQDSRL